MKSVNVSELEGVALDWAVAMAAYPLSYVSGDRLRVRAVVDGEEETIASVFLSNPKGMMREFKPSTDWSQGGPLIEKFGVTIIQQGAFWCADLVGGDCQYAEKPMVAACLAIVSAKFGSTVDVPEELL